MIKNYIFSLSSGFFLILLQIGLGFYLTPFTLQYLSKEEFAIFQIAYDFIIWISLISIGLKGGFSNHLAKNSTDPDYQNKLINTTFFSKAVLSLIIIVIGYLASGFFPSFFDISIEYRDTAKLTLFILSVGLAFSIIGNVFSDIFLVKHKVHEDNFIRIFVVLIRTGLTILLLFKGLKLLALPLAHLFSEILMVVMSLIRMYSKTIAIKLSFRFFSIKHLNISSSSSTWFLLMAVSNLLILQLDKFITGKFLSITLVTILVLTSSLYNIGFNFIQQINKNIRPHLGKYFGSNQNEKAYVLYNLFSKISPGIAIVYGFSIFLINESFISLWVGKENFGGNDLNLALLISFITNSYVLPHRISLTANMQVKQHSLIRFLEGLVNLILSVYLSQKLGVLGVVLATSISIIISMISLPYLNALMYKKSSSALIFFDNLKIIILFAAMLLINMSYQHLFSIDENLWSVTFNFIISFLLGLLLLISFFYKDFKKLLIILRQS